MTNKRFGTDTGINEHIEIDQIDQRQRSLIYFAKEEMPVLKMHRHLFFEGHKFLTTYFHKKV